MTHAMHPYMFWREMREKDYRRIRAGIQTYMNAPIHRDHVCRLDMDGEEVRITRKYPSGSLKGWYAAFSTHKRVLITFGETTKIIPEVNSRHCDGSN